MKQLLAILLAAAVAACGPSDYLPPMDFVRDGEKVSLMAEWNVPQETAVKSGVEVIVSAAESWAQIDQICGADHGHKAAACTLRIGALCMVWLMPEGSIPPEVRARNERHELFGHCNGHEHDIVNDAIVWRKDS